MASPVVQADALSKAYGGRHLFDDATFLVEEGDRVAVVGPNGAGKTTLLTILAGRERPDHGILKLRDGIRSHWFEQHPEYPRDACVRDLLAAPMPVPPALLEEKAALEARIADPALYETDGFESVLERFSTLEQEIRRAAQPPADAWDSPVARSLGFGPKDLDQDIATLSGGERTRLLLARTLGPVREGDLVVLDEPTNHLDVDTIEWLESWIESYDGTLLIVAHDRTFLDNVATRVLEVSAGKVTAYDGDYTDYVTLRDEEVERKRREHVKAMDRLKKAEGTIQQYRQQKRFDGQYASKMKMVERYKAVVDRSPDPVLEQLAFGLRFQGLDKSSNDMLRATGLVKKYDGEAVLSGADFEVQKGDRIGLVGTNGAGKSTLLAILTGRLVPDAGKVHGAPGVRGIFVSQERTDLDESATLADEVRALRPHLEPDSIRALLGRFRFRAEGDPARRVDTLSGGERMRMALLKAMLKPSNLLILDEPTNHLDLDAREVVVKALNTYPGTLIVVSHDRFVLDTTTTSTAVVSEGKVAMFPGTFSETRHLHVVPKRARVVKKHRYVVVKKFTDWSTRRKYLHGEEHLFAKEELEESHTLRNALQNGWIEPT